MVRRTCAKVDLYVSPCPLGSSVVPQRQPPARGMAKGSIGCSWQGQGSSQAQRLHASIALALGDALGNHTGGGATGWYGDVKRVTWVTGVKGTRVGIVSGWVGARGRRNWVGLQARVFLGTLGTP